MATVVPILLIAFGGILVGGAVSLKQQEASKAVIVATWIAAAMALAGGILWLV